MSTILVDLENFGNSVGSSLDGLLTSDWEETDSLKMSMQSMFSRRAPAKPLMFYNPVFYAFNNNVDQKDTPKFVTSISCSDTMKINQKTLLENHAENMNSSPTSSNLSSKEQNICTVKKEEDKEKKQAKEQSAEPSSDDSIMNKMMQTITEKDLKNEASSAAVMSSPLLRNKTIRWAGSRKASGLIREFTLRQNKGRAEDIFTRISQEQVLNDPVMQRLYGAENSSISESLNKQEVSYVRFSALLPPAPKMKRSATSKIKNLIHKLGSNQNNAFGYAVTKFIEETKKFNETRPLVLIHDIRGFMTDIKLCLLLNPNFEYLKKIKEITAENLRQNIDGSIDDCLERLILLPLHRVIYRRLIISYVSSGKLKLLEEAYAINKTKTAYDLGLQKIFTPPNEEDLKVIKSHFIQLQQTYSPYMKLKHLLLAVTTIYKSTRSKSKSRNHQEIGADDFLPLFVYSLLQCEFLAADIEAQYIDGLLDQSLLLGEAGYYLTILISAVQVIFSVKTRPADLPNICDLQSFLKVGIKIDENKETIIYKTLHVPPNMISHNLCQMIALKYKIKNPEEYCLHVVIRDQVWPLKPDECPQLVKTDLVTQISKDSFRFVFIKNSAKIAEKQTPKKRKQSSEKETSIKSKTSSESDFEVKSTKKVETIENKDSVTQVIENPSSNDPPKAKEDNISTGQQFHNPTYEDIPTKIIIHKSSDATTSELHSEDSKPDNIAKESAEVSVNSSSEATDESTSKETTHIEPIKPFSETIELKEQKDVYDDSTSGKEVLEEIEKVVITNDESNVKGSQFETKQDKPILIEKETSQIEKNNEEAVEHLTDKKELNKLGTNDIKESLENISSLSETNQKSEEVFDEDSEKFVIDSKFSNSSITLVDKETNDKQAPPFIQSSTHSSESSSKSDFKSSAESLTESNSGKISRSSSKSDFKSSAESLNESNSGKISRSSSKSDFKSSAESLNKSSSECTSESSLESSSEVQPKVGHKCSLPESNSIRNKEENGKNAAPQIDIKVEAVNEICIEEPNAICLETNDDVKASMDSINKDIKVYSPSIEKMDNSVEIDENVYDELHGKLQLQQDEEIDQLESTSQKNPLSDNSIEINVEDQPAENDYIKYNDPKSINQDEDTKTQVKTNEVETWKKRKPKISAENSQKSSLSAGKVKKRKSELFLEMDESAYISCCNSAKVSTLTQFFESKANAQ